MSFDVLLLGTGNPLPDPDRAGPAYLVRADRASLLFDCGRGVLMRLAAAGVRSPVALDAVLITHLHSDHVTDLADVITTRWVMSLGAPPMRIVGPPGTAAFVERTLAMLVDDIGYRIAHHEDLTDPPAVDVTEVTEGLAFEAPGVRVFAAPTDHRPVHPTVGYRVEQEERSIVIAGDTVPCDGLDSLCRDATIYVQTVVRPSLIAPLPMARFRDVLDYHSSVEDAGRTAARGGVGTLVLTHCVPAPVPGSEGEWIAEAAAHFTGAILLPSDLETVPA